MATWSHCNRARPCAPCSPCAIWKKKASYIFFATRNGTVKKTALKDFSNVMSRGIIAIGIDKDDELVGVHAHRRQPDCLPGIARGQAIRFDEDDVRSMGRPAYGVRGMDLDKGDYIVGHGRHSERAKKAREAEGRAEAECTKHAPTRLCHQGSLILSVTENGYGKRTPVDEYRLQGAAARA